MDTEIRTERLTLRRAGPEDIDALHALVSDFDVVKMTASWPYPANRDFTATRSHPFDPALGMVGPVFLGADLIGMMGVDATAPDATRANMGYMFARAHWGNGYATEMGRALLSHGWQQYGWEAVSACVFDDNPASGRVLQKLGFVETGSCAGFCTARGSDLPLKTYRLDRP